MNDSNVLKITIIILLICFGLFACGSSSSGDSDNATNPADNGNNDGSLPDNSGQTSQATQSNCLIDIVAQAITGPSQSECLPMTADCSGRFAFSGGGYLLYHFKGADPDLISFSGFNNLGQLVFTMETKIIDGSFVLFFTDSANREYRLIDGTEPHQFTVFCPGGDSTVISVENDSHPAVIWLDSIYDKGFDCRLKLIGSDEFASCL